VRLQFQYLLLHPMFMYPIFTMINEFESHSRKLTQNMRVSSHISSKLW